MNAVCFFLSMALAGSALAGESAKPLTTVPPQEGDFAIRNFQFETGETLPEIKLHYTTVGTARRDASGHATNAVLVLHGTNRGGRVFLVPGFAGELFGPGQLLDASKYYIILPDQFGMGLGKSTKPSDGLRAKFPHYDYADLVRISQLLLKDGLKVDHLRLFIGASMGCMEGFLWGESDPDYSDAMLLLSCNPSEVGGRNRMVRKLMVDDIRNDPGWNNGNYTEQPYGLRAALGHVLVIGSSPLNWQRQYPTAALADKYVDDYISENLKNTDANDLMYAYDSSRNYNPAPGLGKIKAHVMLINVLDDFWNPGELDLAQTGMEKVKNGKFVLLPISEQTRGHYTFFVAPVWKNYLQELLEESK